MKHLGLQGKAWLLGLTVALGLLMTDVFMEGPLVHLDRWVHRYNGLRSEPELESLARAYDHAGQRSALFPILFLVAAVLARRHRTWRPLLLSLYVVVSLNLVVGGMKLLIGRAQPSTDHVDVFTGGVIFPSGHTSNMVLTGGLVIYLLKRYTNNPPVRRLLVVVVLATTLTAATSLYLNTHWLSDLIGGALVGGLLLQAAVVIDRSTARVRTDPPALIARLVPGLPVASAGTEPEAGSAAAQGHSG